MTRAKADTVRSYDHGDLAAFPEYHAVRRALDALGRALDRADSDIDRAAFIEAAADMAATSFASSDCDCDACFFGGADLDRTCWPHAAELIAPGRMIGHYRCRTSGDRWLCDWDTPEYR